MSYLRLKKNLQNIVCIHFTVKHLKITWFTWFVVGGFFYTKFLHSAKATWMGWRVVHCVCVWVWVYATECAWGGVACLVCLCFHCVSGSCWLQKQYYSTFYTKCGFCCYPSFIYVCIFEMVPPLSALINSRPIHAALLQLFYILHSSARRLFSCPLINLQSKH